MVEGVTKKSRKHTLSSVLFRHYNIKDIIRAVRKNPNLYYTPLFCYLFLFHTVSLGQSHRVDFQYSPSKYFTAICFPEDWQKTLVSETGSLLYDFGPGPYARALTEISIGVKGDSSRVVRQTGEPASFVSTTLSAKGLTIKQHAFAILPLEHSRTDTKKNSVERIGGLNGCLNWARPAADVDPAFRNVAWGTNRPIRYRVKVARGSRKRVAMGLCESYKPRVGTRIIELHAEGAEPVTVDPLQDRKQNEPVVVIIEAHDADGDGWLRIEAHASPRSPDPNVILNAFWVFPDTMQLSPAAIIRGELSSMAEVYHSCGTELVERAPYRRMDAIIATFEGKESAPIISIRTRRSLVFDSAKGLVTFNGKPFLLARPKPIAMVATSDMVKLEMSKGTKRAELAVIHGIKAGASTDFPDLVAEARRTQEYWSKKFPTPPLVVPDSGIQFLLDANLRNMYQIADVVDGRFQFQPGPTVYRGLWLGDVVFTGETALMLNDTLSARRFLEGALDVQLPSGQLRSLYPAQSLSETPAYIHSLCRYAQWTGNKSWLRKHWPVVQKGIQWLRTMRDQSPPGTSYSGLMPPGFIDGGISTPHADYGTTLWAMIATEKAIAAARWLDETNDARDWQFLFDEFMESFKTAARRDLRSSSAGQTYLPIIVGDTAREVSQRGQYAILLPLTFSSIFQSHDSLLDSIIHYNLAMLDGVTKEGLIANSGWMKDGIWPWLGGIHGMAHHLVGNNEKAFDLLYAVANHAAPTGVWAEEQQQKKDGTNTSGDASNAEASAIFIHFVRNLLVREKPDTLEFLSGVPAEWIHKGATLKINNGLTEYGPASLSLQISKDGKKGELIVSAIDGRGRKGLPVVVLTALKRAGFVSANGTQLPEKLAGSWKKPIRISIVSTH